MFVHYSAIAGGYRGLSEGPKVRFDVSLGNKGSQAESVTPAC